MTNVNQGANQPKRDSRGRWRKGTSGNPSGRPPKKPKGPWTLKTAAFEAFTQMVEVKGANGELTHMELLNLILQKLALNTVKAKPTEQINVLKQLHRAGLLPEAIEDEEPEEIFTEEDRRLLQTVHDALYGPVGQRSRPPAAFD